MCILHDGEWRRKRGLRLRDCNCVRVAVEKKLNAVLIWQNTEFMYQVEVLLQNVNGMQLCCCLISKFVDILK